MNDFNEENELRILEFIQQKYGLEVFTPGLERTEILFRPYVEMAKKRKIKVVIIAGTNGKGQTAHTLSYFLETAKFKTALWTSPHILSLRERFRIMGLDVTYKELEAEIYETDTYLKNDFSIVISFYEFLFFVFLRLALDKKDEKSIDYLILEVGLGGRLDAVNHFDADCACITSISRDHQEILGERYGQIISEKIAVARKGKPLFTQFRLDYLNSITALYCKDHEVLWKPIHIDKKCKSNYFLENQKMAIELFYFLRPEANIPNLDLVPLFKGRREEMTFNGNTFIFIGAHNIEGIRRMVELYSIPNVIDLPTKIVISFSRRPTSEIEVMLKTLVDFFGLKSKILLTSFIHPKALEFKDIEKIDYQFNKKNKGLLNFVSDWKTEINSSKNQKFLVCGSYYFIGAVQRFINSIR